VSSGDTFHPRELFQALARHGVEYVTVGGVAIQAHGAQRFTRDLDVVIATSKDNMDRLAAALSEVDARVLGPDGQRSRATPGAAMLASGDQWHLVTSFGRLDVLTLPVHLGSFADVRARAYDVPLGDVIVPIAHREDLLRMKRASGRPQDLEDVRLLESLGDES
jgi:hypothetical protein